MGLEEDEEAGTVEEEAPWCLRRRTAPLLLCRSMMYSRRPNHAIHRCSPGVPSCSSKWMPQAGMGREPAQLATRREGTTPC